MSELNTRLDRFTAAIVAEAAANTEQTLAALSEKRSAAYAAAEEQILNEVYHYIHGEVGRVRAEAGRQVSRHMLENKRTLYLRREQIAGEVFSEVRARLAEYTASAAYTQRMEAILSEALATLGTPREARVFLRGADSHLAETLAASQPQVKLTFLEGDFVLGGLVADAPALGKRADASFDSSMEGLSGHFAELFGLSLSGEPEEGGVSHE